MGKGKFKLKGILLYSLLFIVTYVVIFFPFLSRSLSTVWEIDGVGQYYPAFLYIGQFIRDFFSTGKFMSFDLRIALGEDVFSALNYYGFGDPLNIIAVFATKSNGAMLFAFMFFLRLYLSGLAFMLYCKYMKLNERLIPVGAFVYVCSGYMFCACLMYIQFLSPLVYFPLLLWACEKFFKEKQWWWMTLISAYAAACTMYLFYYAAIFLVVYALVRCIFLNSKESVNTNVLSRIKNVALDCIMCGIASALGVILAFPITYPSIKGILNSQRANADIKATLTTLTYYKPRIPTIISFFKGFIPTYDEGVYFFHEIPVVSYVAIILLFISYFVLKNKTDRNKQLLIAVVIGCIAYTLPITNIAFSGFADGSSYDRWIFMLAFLFSIVFICSFSDVIELKCKDKSRVYNIVSIATIANVVIIGFLLYEVAGSNFRNAFIDKASVIKYVDSPVNYSETIKSDNGLFRVSNDSLTNINGRPENVQMINDYNGLTFWFSVINPNTQKIADKLEKLNSNGYVSYRMYGLENSKVKESLASVKYYLRHDNEVFPNSYKLKERLDFYGEQWEVYENQDVLPLCYAYDKDFYNTKFEKYYYDDNEVVIKEAARAENIVYDNDSITCDISLEEDSVVLLAIPFSDGWSVTIDDKTAKVYNSSIYYVAVDVAKGKHTLKYTYSAY